MKKTNCRGDLTDIAAKKEALVMHQGVIQGGRVPRGHKLGSQKHTPTSGAHGVCFGRHIGQFTPKQDVNKPTRNLHT